MVAFTSILIFETNGAPKSPKIKQTPRRLKEEIRYSFEHLMAYIVKTFELLAFLHPKLIPEVSIHPTGFLYKIKALNSAPISIPRYSPPQSLAYLLQAIKHPKSEPLPVTTPCIKRIRGLNLDG